MGEPVPGVRWYWGSELYLSGYWFVPWYTDLRSRKRSYLPSIEEKERQRWPPGVSHPFDDSRKHPCPRGPFYLRLDRSGTYALDRTEYWRCYFFGRRHHWLSMHSDIPCGLVCALGGLSYCCCDGAQIISRVRFSIVRSLHVQCFTLWLGKQSAGIHRCWIGRTSTVSIVDVRTQVKGEESFCRWR